MLSICNVYASINVTNNTAGNHTATEYTICGFAYIVGLDVNKAVIPHDRQRLKNIAIDPSIVREFDPHL